MRILHVSDTHGTFPELIDVKTVDVIVHSGDMLPNKTRGTVVEPGFQEDWVRRKLPTMIRWLKGKPLLFCAGNHDFFNPGELLRRAGEEAYSLTNSSYVFGGLNFAGFPYVPWLIGEWNYERGPEDLSMETEDLLGWVASDNIDVIVAHCPPFGILDAVRHERIGNPYLQVDRLHRNDGERVKAILSGHVHESPGIVEINRTIISNAACTQRIVEI
jgi:Icc-related predicted phosphoesterase